MFNSYLYVYFAYVYMFYSCVIVSIFLLNKPFRQLFNANYCNFSCSILRFTDETREVEAFLSSSIVKLFYKFEQKLVIHSSDYEVNRLQLYNDYTSGFDLDSFRGYLLVGSPMMISILLGDII